MKRSWQPINTETKKLNLLVSGRGNHDYSELYPLEEEFIRELRKHLRIEHYTVNYEGVTIRFQNQYCYKFNHEWFEIADEMLPSVAEMAFKAQQMIETAYLNRTMRWEERK